MRATAVIIEHKEPITVGNDFFWLKVRDTLFAYQSNWWKNFCERFEKVSSSILVWFG